jgi:hypothetical protein
MVRTEMERMDIKELKVALVTTVDEIDFLELLNISIEELVEAFSDKIEARQDYVIGKLGLHVDRDSGDDNSDSDS